jgi:proteasome assembly chaperone (PAC2) family protein
VTFAHVIYIPGVLLLGLTVGYILGAKAVRNEIARAKQRLKE